MFKLYWKGECIDQFDTLEEAQKMRVEYNMAYGGGVIIDDGSNDAEYELAMAEMESQ